MISDNQRRSKLASPSGYAFFGLKARDYTQDYTIPILRTKWPTENSLITIIILLKRCFKQKYSWSGCSLIDHVLITILRLNLVKWFTELNQHRSDYNFVPSILIFIYIKNAKMMTNTENEWSVSTFSISFDHNLTLNISISH